MIRVMLSFSTLGYPDYPAGKVNEHELEELDQLIEWGIKYGIHINLCMYGKPEMSNQWPAEIQTEDFFFNKAMQNKVLNYWKMLSKRYVDIPNKYLSFNLMNEPEVGNDEIYTKVFTPIVKAIWEECPNRVIIADTNDVTGEGLAQLGVALSYHFYEPGLVCYYGLDFFSEEFPTVKEPEAWPLVYLPSVLNMERPTLSLEGNYEKGSISVYVHDIITGSKNMLTILADGNIIFEKEITGKTGKNNGELALVQKEFTAEIPDGTKELELKVNADGTIRLTSISIKQKGKTTTVYAHDLNFEDYSSPAAKLIYADGRITNKEKSQSVDWNYYYHKALQPKKELANQYQVGFMVGEFAPFGKLLSKDLLLPYMDMLLGGLTRDGIGWSNGGFIGEMYITNYYPIKGEYHYKKDSSTGLYYNDELLKTYRKYLQ